jgi:hypothetical protein
MSKKTPHRTRQAAPVTAVPAQLAGLLSLVLAQTDTSHADDLARALTVARAALRDAMREDLFDRISEYVEAEAAQGAWRDLHRYVESLEEQTPAPRFTQPDYQNAYGGPSLYMGMALAYVYLTEGGVR